ncbi:MAG: DNA-processing protein DprA [Rikenellaceae bacterium]|nr:DNA-processing protein DprA [Rikenellaceae bacterium]
MLLESIALSFVPGLGARGAVHLLECFGSAEAVYAASEQEIIERADLRQDIARAIVQRRGFSEAEREIAYCSRNGITPVSSDDKAFPSLLREIDDYPTVIYVCGSVEALSRPSVAFVGTRKMSSYGQRMCEEFISSLKELVPEVSIVSGLAYGIDGASHRAALMAGATTVGVLANVLPSVAPVANERLAAEIVSRGGALVTELNSQTKQNGRYFIPRNRIIAALSAGVVVVESAESGGSLSTAAFADGYNRQVMAVPGRVSDGNSRGCNMLIRNRKAQMVLSGEDIVRELQWELGLEQEPSVAPAALPLTDAEQAFVELFDSEPLGIDELAERSGLSAGELTLMLMNLELSGAVRTLPGKRYEKAL